MRFSFPALALLLACGSAHAFTAADTHTPLSVDLAAGHVVAVHGRIVPSSVEIVRSALDRVRGRVTVLINSPGGSIAPALAIGRLIRDRLAAVAVAPRVAGEPADTRAQCASACVLVLAAGAVRTVGASAAVGVHRLTDWTTYSRTWDVYRVDRSVGGAVRRSLLSRRVLSSHDVYTDAAPQAYAAVRTYLAQMGERPALVTLMKATPAARLHWMTPGELATTRLVTGAAHRS